MAEGDHRPGRRAQRLLELVTSDGAFIVNTLSDSIVEARRRAVYRFDTGAAGAPSRVTRAMFPLGSRSRGTGRCLVGRCVHLRGDDCPLAARSPRSSVSRSSRENAGPRSP